jgi:hypothetical protein
MQFPNFYRVISARRSRRLIERAGLIVVAAALLPAVAQATPVGSLVFSAPTMDVAQGSSGSFDLLISNSSPSSLGLSAESVQLGVGGGGDVLFTNTDANTTTSYVFPDSFDVDEASTLDVSGIPYPKTDFATSDLSDAPSSFVTIASGATFGLVHVSYSVSPTATLGEHDLTFGNIPADTSASDDNFQTAPLTAFDGALNVVAAPEPASVGLILLAAPLLLHRRGLFQSR